MNNKFVDISPKALEDIDKAALYLNVEANMETAVRFYDATHRSFNVLLENPGMARHARLLIQKLVRFGNGR